MLSRRLGADVRRVGDDAAGDHLVGTIGSGARQVLLLANGARKTGPVTEAVLGEVTTDVPLSYVQKYVADGGNMTFVLDETAAAELLANAPALAERGYELVDHRDEPYPSVTSITFARSPQTGTLS